MARNSRIIRDWTPERVEDTPVAPHRYRWDEEEDYPTEYRAFRECSPYKPGDVVYVVDGDGYRRARVYLVLVDRNSYGEYRHLYRVQHGTKEGLWGKLWVNTWPGMIQRGYQRAGLAPEMPKD